MALGFAQDNNLRESQDASSAAGIFNNLGGTGISDDIKLFAGNLTYFTALDYDSSGFTASTLPYYSPEEEIYDQTSGELPSVQYTYVYIPPTTFGRKPFSNGTVLFTFDDNYNKIYHITDDSNGIDRFRIYEYQKSGGTKGALRSWQFFYNLNDKTFYREEPVYFSNINNFSRPRQSLNDESSGITNPYRNSDGASLLSDSRDRSKQITFLKLISVNTFQTSIEGATEGLQYKESRNLVNYKQNTFKRLMEFGGPVHLVNTNNLSLTNDENAKTMPGLYIYGGGISARAFSGRNNPWVKASNHTITNSPSNLQIDAIKTKDVDLTGGNNLTNSQGARVLNLIWEQSPTIYTKGIGANLSVRSISSPIEVGPNWTHKAKVTVNGENYFLLLTNNESTFNN